MCWPNVKLYFTKNVGQKYIIQCHIKVKLVEYQIYFDSI